MREERRTRLGSPGAAASPGRTRMTPFFPLLPRGRDGGRALESKRAPPAQARVPLFFLLSMRDGRRTRLGSPGAAAPTRPGPNASIFPAVYAGWTTGRALEARERPPPPVQARMPPVFPLRPAGGTENACRNARKRPPCPPKAQKRAPPLPRTADGRRPLPPEKGGSLLQMRHVRRGASVGIEQAVAQVEQLVGEVHLVHVGVALAGVLFPQAGQLLFAAGLNLQ